MSDVRLFGRPSITDKPTFKLNWLGKVQKTHTEDNNLVPLCYNCINLYFTIFCISPKLDPLSSGERVYCPEKNNLPSFQLFDLGKGQKLDSRINKHYRALATLDTFL